MPQISYELKLSANTATGDNGPSLYAVHVTDPVAQQPKPDLVVHIELRGAGSLAAGARTTSIDETTREDGKAYFSWWPSEGDAGTEAELLIQAAGDEYLLEVIPLTPSREDDVTDSVQESYDPQREAIESRAYELYVERGMEHGRDVEDWHRAESEVRGSDR